MAQQKETDWRKKYRPYIAAAVLAFIMTMLVAPEVADGSAMSPTIDEGQVIVVYKTRYSENRGAPDYGDVVCFFEDFYQEGKKGEQTFSRVIGLPGDTIRVTENGTFQNETRLDQEPYATGETTGSAMTYEIQPGEVFVLGDNRVHAIDSRHPEVGPLQMREIRGKCVLRVWPLNAFGMIKSK